MKRITIFAALWFCVLLLLFVFATPLSEGLFLLFLPVRWGVILAGGVIAVLALVRMKGNAGRSGLVLVICAVGFALFFSVGFEWGRYVLFQIRKPGYEQLLLEAKQLGNVPRNTGYTEEGPPKLYAFYWYRGVTDNWSGVVYDPTGKIEQINDADGWDEIHSIGLSRLFGGTFYKCQDVGGGWYICWFT